MAQRDFDETNLKNKEVVTEVHSFILGGKTFRLKSILPPKFYLREMQGVDGMIDFVRMMIVKEDREAFDELLDADDIPLELTDVIDISNWIVEVYANRPTDGSASSLDGQEPTSPSSEETPSETATTGSP